jgi:hypothetical protein
MAKGGLDAKKTGNTKKIRVQVEGEVMEITREDGKDPVVTGGTEDQDQLDLNKLPPDTVIFTHTNPTCGYYYFNGRLWYK